MVASRGPGPCAPPYGYAPDYAMYGNDLNHSFKCLLIINY
jgi:hypothetical protein